MVVVRCALPLLLSLSLGCAEDMQGFFIDQNYWWGHLGGAWMMAQDSNDTITAVGSTDTLRFWPLSGKRDGDQITLDFAAVEWSKEELGMFRRQKLMLPRPGQPYLKHGTYDFAEHWIIFSPRNRWFHNSPPLRVSSAPPTTMESPRMEGFFVDKRRWAGGLAYSMMVSDAADRITIVGTDDGVTFWSKHGHYTDKAAKEFEITSTPLAPQGGKFVQREHQIVIDVQMDIVATGTSHTIIWDDGSEWDRRDVEIMSPTDLDPSARRLGAELGFATNQD